MTENVLQTLSAEHDRHWWALLPKPVLFGLLTAAFAVALWHEVEWRREVNTTLRSAASREDLTRALDEVKEIRVDQLRFYAWQAERAGDWAKAAELHAKLLKETKETTTP